MFLGLLVWLNGPGLRWLAPKVAGHFLGKAGMTAEFQLRGSLTGGLSLYGLKLGGDTAIENLTIDRIVPQYRWSRLRKGQLDGLEISGVHADLRLGLEKPPEEEEKKPLDLEQLTATIRNAREKFVPVRLELRDISVTARKEGDLVFALAPSDITHASGSEEIHIALGEMTDATGRKWPAQNTEIAWQPDHLLIGRLDPYPAVSLRRLMLRLPEAGGMSLESELHLHEAVFVLDSTPGFVSAKLDLLQGELRIDEAARGFGVEIPASAKLTSLALEFDDLMPDPKQAVGRARLLLEEIRYQDWDVPELTVDAGLEKERATVNANGRLLDTNVTLEAIAGLVRKPESFLLGKTTGAFAVAEVENVVRGLEEKVTAIDPGAPVPSSSIEGNFEVDFEANQPQRADFSVTLEPRDPQLAAPVSVRARWQGPQPIEAQIATDGLQLAATYDLEVKTYEGTLLLEEFTSSRIDRWLGIARVKMPGTVRVSGSWKGEGDVANGSHSGDLALVDAVWNRPEAEPVTAKGDVSYRWPFTAEVRGLQAATQGQTIALDAALADQLLELRHFQWTDGETEMAEGSGRLPVPADFSQWREMLANDPRPVQLAISTKVLSLARLEPWLPAAKQLDARSSGQLLLRMDGTYAAPVINAKLIARDLRSPAKPDLPPADLEIDIDSDVEKGIRIEGNMLAPDLPATRIQAAMPFRPGIWATDPGILKEEEISARVDLPRLDISRFQSLVPQAQELGGVITGDVVVSGKVAKPDVRGHLDFANGTFAMDNDAVPAIRGAGASIDFALDRVVLKSLRATLAGGTLSGEGSVDIQEGALGDLNLRLRGNHLPVLRNDLLIMRTNADLTLQGTLQNATLSGTIGLVDSVFYRDIEILPIGKPFLGPSAAALPKIDAPRNPTAAVPEPFSGWGLNLLLRTEEPFLVRGNFATGEATGSIRVRGTIGSPQPDGEVRVRNVRALLPFSTLNVRSGSLIFTPATGLDPILEIRGTSEPRPYRVDIYVYGRLSDPQLILTSNPPLPETEIMTLLATGTTTSGLTDTQAASSRGLQLLAEEIRRGRFRYSEKLRPILGLLDNVDFSLSEADPYTSDTFSTATVKLTDRYYVSAGLGAEGDTRLLGIWRFSFR